jgi:putative CocE/NonD family hydrolase
MTAKWYPRALALCLLALFGTAILESAAAQEKPQREIEDVPQYIHDNYTKEEHRIAMRDGVRLFTTIYSPKETSQRYPILMMRTPYSVRPYGKDSMPRFLGPNKYLLKEGYIFVYQDVRGCYLSEGQFVNMTPHIDNKTRKTDIDESSDTYDTIDWLLANVRNHNGRVGQWGISYPGFYASAGMIDAHPALKAVSPQAPIADWFFDDFHHHGTLFLPHAFNFLAVFGQPRPKPTTGSLGRFNHHTQDGYQFFLDLGPLKNVNERYYKNRVAFWNDMVQHPNYDQFWQARNLLPHLKKVAPAVMTVGGWFDAEDLYGACKTYRAVEEANPGIYNVIVMGPWRHGGWARGGGDRLGNISFGSRTSDYFQQNLEHAFFERFLKDKAEQAPPEASMFETGANRWRTFEHWPPRELEKTALYFVDGGRLASAPPSDDADTRDEFVSDPNRPVPFTEVVSPQMTPEYMTDDQRFAARRPDVLVFQTDVLKSDLTLAGPLLADLWVSTSGTDADWVVKLIDVFPNDAEDYPEMRTGEHLGGYEMMVRSEAIRGRFRNSYERPEAFVPDQPAKVTLELQDVLHTFARGHRVMVQVQSTWFPLIDRNPQKYVPNIFLADDKDFTKATHRVYHSRQHPSCLRIGILPPERADRSAGTTSGGR